MKNLYYSIVAVAVFSFTFCMQLSAQSCNRALQPLIDLLQETNPGSGDGLVTISWDANCADRDPFADGQSLCPPTDMNSLIWYVGFYGQNSPAPNGLLAECDTGNATSECVGFPSTPIANGTDDATCLDPKGSTCVSGEMSQQIPPGTGDIHTWHIAGADNGGDGGYCDGLFTFQWQLCPGQCYNVVMWELIVDQPTGTGPTPDAFDGNTLPFPGIDNNAACMNLGIVDESPASPIAVICMSGANTPVTIPTLTVTSDIGTCGPLVSQPFTGTYQGQPEDIGDGGPDNVDFYDGVPCTVQDIDQQIVIDQATGAVDPVIGATSNGGDAGDISVVLGPPPAGGSPSANGMLGLGAHVLEINCRENIRIEFNTPTTCEGAPRPISNPPCVDTDGTFFSNSKIYISNNGMPIQANPGGAAYPACDFVTEADEIFIAPIGVGTASCTTNMGVGYPADWTAQFGNFLSENPDGTDCVRNLVGNPFAGTGVSPFGLPGTQTMDFGDGITRQVSTICVSFEDPCDGSKSATCVKFISDASPLTATVIQCHETCWDGMGSSMDGSVTLSVFGGSGDPLADGSGSFAGYTNTLNGMAPTSMSGNQFTWTGLPAGVYDILIVDGMAPSCGSACDITQCAIILPDPEHDLLSDTLTVACGGDVAIPVTGSTIRTTDNGVQTIIDDLGGPASGVPLDGDGTAGNDCAAGDGTFDAIAIDLSSFFAGCTDQRLTQIAVKEVCFSTAGTSGADIGLEGLIVTLFAPDFSGIELMRGGCFGGVGPCVTGSGHADNLCFTLGGGDTWGGTSATTGTFDSRDPATNFTGGPSGVWFLGFNSAECFNFMNFSTFVTDINITFNDFTCTETTGITDFTACAGATPGPAPADSPNGVLTWTPNANGTVTPAAGDVALSGSSDHIGTFTDPTPADGVCDRYCYTVSGFMPGGNFDIASVSDASCINGECCYVETQICFDTQSIPLITAEATTGCSGNGMANGMVNITVTGCGGPYSVTGDLTGSIPAGGSGSVAIGLAAEGTANYTITDANGCMVSDDIFIAADCLPAELVAFKGEAQERVNELTWETASETNTAWFAIERTRNIDGKETWEELGRVAAAGYSLEHLTYAFTDVKPLTVGYYRLKTIDLDGTYEYSNIININRKENRKGIVEVFPIPTDNEVTVQYEVTTNTDVTFTLTDVLGRVVSQETVEANQGVNYYSVDMTTRATGLYFVTFTDGTIEQTRRVIKN